MQRSLLLILVAVSYGVFAGAPHWTLAPLLGLTALVILVAPARTLKFPRAWRALDLSLLALVIGIGLQALPLPTALVSVLSPHALELRAAVALSLPGGSTPAWSTLSINPTLTLDALGVVLLGVGSFLISRGVFSSGGSTRQFCRMLALIGAAAAISALVFRMAAPKMLFGMLRPTAQSATPFGAFVNRNHFGGWMVMAVTPVCGYLIAHLRIHPSYRGRWRMRLQQFMASGAFVIAMADFVMVGSMLLTLSRSSVAALSAAALAGWRLGRERLRIERTNLPAVLAICGVALLGFVLFVDIEGWTSRLTNDTVSSSDRSRLTIWKETLPMIRDFWATGTGAGTFADGMLHYQQSRVWIPAMGKWALFNNAHSHYLQVAAEGGLLLALPAASAALWLLILGRKAVAADRGEMFWTRVGAAAGLVGMAVQNIWETSLIMPANAVLCGTLMGLLIYERSGASAQPSTRDLPPPVRPRPAR